MTERERLIEAVAYAFVDNDCDVADRGVADQHWRERCEDARIAISALETEGYRPPPSGDVVEQAAAVLLEEFWCNDCDPVDGSCKSCSDRAATYARKLAHYGLLALAQIQGVEAETSGEYVSIPVPPPDELVEQLARAMFEVARGGWPAPHDTWEPTSPDTRNWYRRLASAALRALGEATDG